MISLRTLLLATSACASGTAFAVPPTTLPTKNLPANLPAAPAGQSIQDLESSALKAFEGNDYLSALPLLKDLSVRERNSPDKVAPILEKIRVCESNLAKQATPVEGINAPRTAHVKPKDGDVYTVELKKLGNFNYDADQGGNIPDDVKALTGTTVKIHGYMIPIDESDKISKFVLVPDLFACCFGQPPSLQHTAVVTCPAGKAVSYYPEEINVTGTLKVEEKRDEGFVVNIFEVQANSIRPLAK